MDRLSPMSCGADSGIHSLSSPATPQKKRQLSPECEGETAGTEANDGEVIPTKKQRLEVETTDAFVPTSGNTSVESESLERSPTPIVACSKAPQCGDECRQQPSTSAEVIEDLLETTNSHLEESEERELLDLQDLEINISCHWDTCKQKFPSLNDVYDHVVELHLGTMATKSDDEDIECMWDDCEMSLSRGNWNKKVNWLREHYRTRHAKHAQTFKCLIEGCRFRSVTCGRLEEHVRREHINEPKKQKTPKVKTESWAGWQYQRYWPREVLPGAAFAWGRYYNEQLQDRLCKMRDMDWNCKLQPRRRAGVGAAHRKCSIVVGYDIVPASPKKKVDKKDLEEESEDEEEVDTSYQSLTLDDLFPGYNYAEKSELRNQEELKAHEEESRKFRDKQRYLKWRQEHNRHQKKVSIDNEVYPR